MRWSWGILLVAACFSPHAAPGVACGENGVCPTGLVCSPASNTCELTASDAQVSLLVDATPTDGQADAPRDAFVPPIDGCVPSAEICGDGIDQDCNGSDAVCPPNDEAGGAIDITAGGGFTAQLDAAHANDGPHGCGMMGGRDVYYKVVLAAPTVFYLDTFGSDFDSVIRVYPGIACGVGTGMSATCGDDACGTPRSQLALTLPTGTSCVVIAQKSSTETTGNLTLHATNTGHTGTALPAFAGNTASAATTTTCGATEVTQDDCTTPAAGPSLDYYFMTCPGDHTADVSDCDATWDSVAYVKPAKFGTDLDCDDDAQDNGGTPCAANNDSASFVPAVPVNGPALFWAGIGGYTATDCGSFTLTVALH